jgi:hypothetical protein
MFPVGSGRTRARPAARQGRRRQPPNRQPVRGGCPLAEGPGRARVRALAAAGRPVEERKRKLDGRVLRYPCLGLEVAPARAVLLYRVAEGLDLHGLRIPAGSASLGVFWPDRPYNVYRWLAPDGQPLGLYCNAATGTRIAADAVQWLDLEVDVVIAPDGRHRVVDLDQVPAGLGRAHRRALHDALRRLRDPCAVAREVEEITARFAGIASGAGPCGAGGRAVGGCGVAQSALLRGQSAGAP